VSRADVTAVGCGPGHSATASDHGQDQARKLHRSPERGLRWSFKQPMADGDQLRTQHKVGKLAQRGDRDLATLREACEGR